MSWSDVIDIKDKMQNDNSIKKLALLYFEGKATDEEEQRVLDFIMESAQNKHTFGDWENDWAKSHIPEIKTERAWEELKEKMKQR